MKNPIIERDWAVTESLLPEGWQMQARRLGAFVRKTNIPDPTTLLRILLAYLSGETSLAVTAARAATQKMVNHLSGPALLKRLRNSYEWIAWMCRQMMFEQDLVPLGGVPSGRRLRLCDATVIVHGRQRWRLHWSFTFPEARCDFALICPVKGKGSGETFTHWNFRPGDIMLGDAIYGARAGVACALSEGADVIARYCPSNFPLLDNQAKAFDVVALLPDEADVGLCLEWKDLWFEQGGRLWGPMRLIAKRLDEKSARQAAQRKKRKASKSGFKTTPKTLKASKWLLVLTSLPAEQFASEWILSCYRLRWQVEVSFRRMKGVIKLGCMRSLTPDSCRAWIQGKLLLALLCERVVPPRLLLRPPVVMRSV